MNQLEAPPHSFIVKIWPEGASGEADRATWHGYITHVPSGERRYLKDLDEIIGFVALYLEGMEIRLPICWRVKSCLKRFRMCLNNLLNSLQVKEETDGLS